MDSYYRLGAEAAGIVLDADEVAAVVGGYLAPAVAAGQHDGLRLEEVVVRGDTVRVTLACRPRLPFTAALGVAESFPVTASLLIRP